MTIHELVTITAHGATMDLPPKSGDATIYIYIYKTVFLRNLSFGSAPFWDNYDVLFLCLSLSLSLLFYFSISLSHYAFNKQLEVQRVTQSTC